MRRRRRANAIQPNTMATRVSVTNPGAPRRSKASPNVKKGRRSATQPSMTRRVTQPTTTSQTSPTRSNPMRQGGRGLNPPQRGGSVRPNVDTYERGSLSTTEGGSNWTKEQSHTALLPPFLCNFLYLGPSTHTIHMGSQYIQ